LETSRLGHFLDSPACLAVKACEWSQQIGSLSLNLSTFAENETDADCQSAKRKPAGLRYKAGEPRADFSIYEAVPI
jgi:hypothetical protein